MKEIKFSMDDEVYDLIRSEHGIKNLCGNTEGVCDELISMMINSIEKGEKEISLTINKDKNHNKKKNQKN